MLSYPNPPWMMVGKAAMSLYLVPSKAIHLPSELHLVSKFGFSLGILSFIHYLPPSPLEYHELIWMPTIVRQGRWKGFYVEKMLVDSAPALKGGRDLWALPKTMATFQKRGREIEICEGTHPLLMLSPRRGQLWIPFSWKASTLQIRKGETISFRASWQGKVHLSSLKTTFLASPTPQWRSLSSARKILTLSIDPFQSIMHPPKIRREKRIKNS